MNKFSAIYKTLADAPNSQIDNCFIPLFTVLAKKEDFDPMDMLTILNQCAYASLASDFAMQAMHFIFEDMCKAKGLDSLKILRENELSERN